MSRISILRAITSIAAAAVLLSGAGCGHVKGNFLPNSRPTVELTSAPTNSTDKYFYAYRLNWSGNDPDGKVDYFLYAIDPPNSAQVAAGAETAWVKTTKNEQIVFFRATVPDSGAPISRPTASDYHVFVIRSVDNGGLFSEPKIRAFNAYTVAPSVLIISPQPSELLEAQVTPAVRISWTGSDPDGQFTQKPVKYKFKLIKEDDPEYSQQKALQFPDSLRLFYAARNWAGWDSTSAETTTVQYTNLTPKSKFLFVLIGFDEAGAYSPVFSRSSNMLLFNVGFAGTLGPVFTLFNEFFFFTYPSGGYTPGDELSWIKLEIPADRALTFNWFAQAPPGSTIEYYRWMVDGNVADETPRTKESSDFIHWSQKSPGTTSATIGPFEPNTTHFLYVETKDNNDLKSLAVVKLNPVRPTFAKQLLIVDDTRLEVDKLQSNGCSRRYTTDWPAAAEIDTFMYARGNVPWRCTFVNNTGSNPVPIGGAITKPGVFAGYSFDTLGTRQGFELASSGVPLSVLGRYKNLVWMVDSRGAQLDASPTSTVDPSTTLRWMSTPGRSSTLSTYIFSGGKVWMLGGGAAYASLIGFNAKGAKENDKLYGLDQTIFSATSNELAPGRLMYDAAHWQSELTVQQKPTVILKSPAAIGGWSNPGPGYVGTINAPNYDLLPPQMRPRDIALGDSLPPTRSTGQAGSYFLNGASLDLEYLDLPNVITEDMDPDPLVENPRAALDTLYELQGGQLSTLKTGFRPIAMTYYHGVQGPAFVFSGFNIWTYSRQDVIGLVDFVMQQVFGLTRSPINRGAASPAALARPGAQPSRVVTPAQRSLNAHLPLGRTRE